MPWFFFFNYIKLYKKLWISLGFLKQVSVASAITRFLCVDKDALLLRDREGVSVREKLLCLGDISQAEKKTWELSHRLLLNSTANLNILWSMSHKINCQCMSANTTIYTPICQFVLRGNQTALSQYQHKTWNLSLINEAVRLSLWHGRRFENLEPWAWWNG